MAEKKFITLDGMQRFMTWIDEALILVQNNYKTLIDNLKSTIDTKSPSWDAKYNKPVSGIPKEHLDAAVQSSLDKADAAASKTELEAAELALSSAIAASQNNDQNNTFDELLADTVNVTHAVNVQGYDINANKVQEWNSKQSAISDLADIRSGSSAGATALQPSALNAYRTSADQDAIDNGKQPTISDLATIRNNASSGATHASSTGNPHSTTFAQINSKPTTINGYGITDSYTKTQVDQSELSLASSVAALEGRVAAIESWLKSMNADDILTQVVNITKAINLGGVDIVPDGGGIKVKGNITATGTITPNV